MCLNTHKWQQRVSMAVLSSRSCAMEAGNHDASFELWFMKHPLHYMGILILEGPPLPKCALVYELFCGQHHCTGLLVHHDSS